MAAAKETEWDKLMEMWMKTPLEMYKTGQRVAMESMGVNGTETGKDSWTSLMEGMACAAPWKAFMEGQYDPDSPGKKEDKEKQKPGDDKERRSFQHAAEELGKMWCKRMAGGTQWFEKYREALGDHTASSGNFARDMGMFGVEAFNRAFETAVRNAMFKRVGPARNFQVKIDASMEKMSEFNVAAMEFYHYLSLPVISAARTMLHEMTRQGNKAMTAEGAKAIYSRWLSEMETQYAALFTTPAYIKALDYFVQAASDARAAMLSLNNDIYRQMGIASLEEMDDITLELYQLKKKVDAFEIHYAHAPGVAA